MDDARALELLEGLTGNFPGTAFICDQSGAVRAAGDTARSLLDLNPRDILGRPLDEVLCSDSGEGEQLRHALDSALRGGSCGAHCRRDKFDIACQLTPLDERDGGVMAVAVPLGPGMEANTDGTRTGDVDPVTGVLSRLALRARCWTLFESNPDTPYLATRLRVDGLRRINQSHGQDVGDRALRRIAGRLEGMLGEGEYIARVSGNEFILLTGHRNPGEARQWLESLIALFDEPLTVGEEVFMFHLQAGMAFYPDDARSPPELGRRSAVALERARNMGSNHAFFSEEWEQHLATQGWVPGALNRALNQDGLGLHYHPVIDRDGHVAWMEALVRWHHPERGMIPPGVFIPIAEGLPLMQALDFWVLERGCSEAKDLGVPVAVNITPDTLTAPDFLSRLDRVLKKTGLPLRWLTLEITERVLSQPEATRPLVAAIRDRGILVAVDDFGVGYSALSYLWQYPVDELKLDGSFVRAAVRDKRARDVIRSLVDLSRRLDLKLVAEQVESEADHRWLHKAGVGFQQGFYFCRPLPAPELHGWLEKAGRSVWKTC